MYSSIGIGMKFTYTGIEVKDLDKSIAFYRDVLAMEYLGRHKIESTGGEVAAFKNPGSDHVLEMNWYPNSKYREGSELDHLAFECDDVEREVQRLLKAGATMARPAEVRPKYIVGFVKDPNGIWLELYQERA
ncbi:MAG: VOC family protein [Methanobacteriota archaeon]|nr:MAG: VOC family protein [Euryarchaeota archaeon]